MTPIDSVEDGLDKDDAPGDGEEEEEEAVAEVRLARRSHWLCSRCGTLSEWHSPGSWNMDCTKKPRPPSARTRRHTLVYYEATTEGQEALGRLLNNAKKRQRNPRWGELPSGLHSRKKCRTNFS